MLIDTKTPIIGANGGDLTPYMLKNSGFADLLKVEDAKETIRELTENGMQGMWEWQMQQLKSKIAGDVMAELGIDEDDLESMAPEARLDLERRIMDEVQKRLEAIMADESKKNMQEGKNELGTSRPLILPTPDMKPDTSYMANEYTKKLTKQDV